MTRKNFLSSAKELKKNSQLTSNPIKYVIKFIQDKTFKSNVRKAWNTIEKSSTKKGDSAPKIICFAKGPYENGDHGALFEFWVGGKGGHYECRISFNWENDFKITIYTNCDYLKRNEDEIMLYACKTFTPAKEKEAKKYFIDLVYELAKARMEGKC
jgi:hypothetical protein